MKYKVTAITINTQVEPLSYSEPRAEIIDSIENELFTDCENIQDIEFTYESFWNYLNSPDTVHNPQEKVKVVSVIPVSH